MKKNAPVAFLCGLALFGIASCGDEEPKLPTPTPPAGEPLPDYLANAPLGGEYVGDAYVVNDTCGFLMQERPDKVHFYWYPLDVEEQLFSARIGTLKFNDILPSPMAEGDRLWYLIAHKETVELPSYGEVDIFHLDGMIERGVMKLAYSYEAYEGTKNMLGSKVCGARFDLRLKKAVNYSYTERYTIE